jgi:hypothetical protein
VRATVADDAMRWLGSVTGGPDGTSGVNRRLARSAAETRLARGYYAAGQVADKSINGQIRSIRAKSSGGSYSRCRNSLSDNGSNISSGISRPRSKPGSRGPSSLTRTCSTSALPARPTKTSSPGTAGGPASERLATVFFALPFTLKPFRSQPSTRWCTELGGRAPSSTGRPQQSRGGAAEKKDNANERKWPQTNTNMLVPLKHPDVPQAQTQREFMRRALRSFRVHLRPFAFICVILLLLPSASR